MPKTVPYHPTIKSALGIYTGDIITTSYNTGPYIIHNVHGPITSFTGVGYLVILDHPEISLTLSTPNAKRKSTGGYINNIRQVNDRWYTAQNEALPQKSDYSVTFGASGISAPKINLTDWTGVQRE